MARPAKTTEVVEIRPINIATVNIRLVGDTPLIMHRWTEKAKREMLDNMMKKTKTQSKDPKDPVAEFITSMYWLTDMPEDLTEAGFEAAIANGARFGFPVTAFKQAGISAAYRLGWAKDKMSFRGSFFLNSDENQLVEIKSDPPVMREDAVKISMGKPDLRYRGEFRNWYVDLELQYNTNGKHSLEQIINIINAGGYVCGVGEWRPERDGQYGMFHVETV